jgi:hypothetical protein
MGSYTATAGNGLQSRAHATGPEAGTWGVTHAVSTIGNPGTKQQGWRQPAPRICEPLSWLAVSGVHGSPPRGAGIQVSGSPNTDVHLQSNPILASSGGERHLPV